jgi:hypothetical protein
MRHVISFLKMEEERSIQELAIVEIGERYGAFRIITPRADSAMVKSIRKYGQISPVVCVRGEGRYVWATVKTASNISVKVSF